jgi:hypothetical protein
MTRCLRERTEEEVLVERARAAVDVTSDEVDVQRGDVGGREHDPLQRRPLEVLDVTAETSGDPIGVRLSEHFGPGAVSDVDLVGCVSLDPASGKLLELDPDDPRASGGTRRIDGHRLSAHDGRLGGEKASLGLVDGA